MADEDGFPAVVPDQGVRRNRIVRKRCPFVIGQHGGAAIIGGAVGDVSVRYGAIVISAVQLNNRVRLFSALVTEATETQALLRKINQINDGVHRIRVFLHDHVVYAALDVPADPFVPAHMVAAMNEFSEVAEGLAIVLRAESSGKAIIEPSGPFSGLH